MSVTARDDYEQRQDAWLAACASREADSGGRRHGEPDHPYRTCFQRDRDRIVHCSAFRRLDFKTQVFVPHEHDHFRTRLTHTLEVAQVGRTIGRALRLNEDLIEAVALAHDLGHPPFGHSGEYALDALMAGAGGFEHNRQSLRVVDYLEHPYPGFRGLNLTQVVRECLATHQTRYDTPAAEEFDANAPGPLEGQVVDVADEIAYTAADLDDALAAGWITTDDLVDLEIWRAAWSAAEADYGDARWIHKRIRARVTILSMMVDDVVAETARRVAAIGPAVNVRQAERCAGFSGDVGRQVAALQEFLLRRVYEHPTGLAHSQAARETIAALFEHLVRCPEDLPDRYRGRVAEQGTHRVVCDYIAGMTDRFCTDQAAQVGA